MDKKQLLDLVERVLDAIGLRSEAAVNLVMGTAAQESHLGRYIRQINGPALGICQMEPATEADIWDNWLAYHQDVAAAIRGLTGHSGPGLWLEWDLAYQIAMCRCHYRRVPAALPAADDVYGLAAYWKQYYNTPAGAGSVGEFISNYRRLVGRET